MKDITRHSLIANTICKSKIIVKGTGTISKISRKYQYTNVCMQDIVFTFNDKKYCLDHCWLQQTDYPKEWIEQMEVGKAFGISFTFYPYRSAVGRGMYGMTISTSRELVR